MLELYKNIKNRRKELNMTQTELALKIGYADKSSIARIEKGEIDLPLSKVKEFAAALEIDTNDLLGDGYYNEVPDYVPGTVEVIDLYSKATPEQRKAVLNLLRSFVTD